MSGVMFYKLVNPNGNIQEELMPVDIASYNVLCRIRKEVPREKKTEKQEDP